MKPLIGVGLERNPPETRGVGSSAGTSSGPVSAPRIGVVRNPKSHRNKGFQPEVASAPDILTAIPQTREELTRNLADFAAQGVELLVIDGGDGTVRDVLSRGAAAFGAHWPRLVVLPKGKTNALAADLGLPAAWPPADAIGSSDRARTEIRRPMIIERIDGDETVAMGFILGGGVFNTAIDAGQVAHRYGAFQGFAVAVTAAFGMVQALFGFGKSPWRALSPMNVAIGPDRQEVPQSGHGAPGLRFACGMSTLNGFPLGMRPFGKAGPGIKYLVIDAPLRRVISMVPALLMGLDRPFLKRLGVHRGSADEIVLRLGGKFILDGEAFPPGDYRLRQGPELHFLVP